MDGYGGLKKEGAVGKNLTKSTSSPNLELNTTAFAGMNPGLAPGFNLAGLGFAGSGLFPSLGTAGQQPTAQELALAQLQLQALQMNLASTALGLSTSASDPTGLNTTNLNRSSAPPNQASNSITSDSSPETSTQSLPQSNQQIDLANQLSMLQLLNQLKMSQAQNQSQGGDPIVAAKEFTGGSGMNLGVGLGLVPSPSATLGASALGTGAMGNNLSVDGAGASSKILGCLLRHSCVLR